MNKGTVPEQFYKNGYLQYDDFELQQIAQELSQTVPQYNQLILNIIRYSQNPVERTKAATLLSWAKHPENVSIILKENLLNDPDTRVRNELARSFSYLINDVKNKKILNASIDACCEQITLPSHSDRTKALAALLLIFQLHPELNSSLHYQCKETLLYINRMSIYLFHFEIRSFRSVFARSIATKQSRIFRIFSGLLRCARNDGHLNFK